MKRCLLFICILTIINVIASSCVGAIPELLRDEDLKMDASPHNIEFVYWLPPEYDYIYATSSDYLVLEKDGTTTIIDNNKNEILSTSEYAIISISEDMVCVKSMENLKYGLIDLNGEV